MPYIYLAHLLRFNLKYGATIILKNRLPRNDPVIFVLHDTFEHFYGVNKSEFHDDILNFHPAVMLESAIEVLCPAVLTFLPKVKYGNEGL